MVKRETIERSKEATPSLGHVVGKPTLTDDETARVVAVMRALKREKFNENGAAMARALEVSQPNVSAILSGTHRPSYATAKKVAALHGVDVGDLLGHGLAARARMVTPETHPNLYAALRMTRDQIRGLTREHVVGAAERLPDLALGTWVSILTDPAHAKLEQIAAPRREEPKTLEIRIDPPPATEERAKAKNRR